MLPIKKVTAFNLVNNIAIVGMTMIDLQAGLLLVGLLFAYEHSADIVNRDKKIRQQRQLKKQM